MIERILLVERGITVGHPDIVPQNYERILLESIGGLGYFEHRLLDFLISSIDVNANFSEQLYINSLSVINHLNMSQLRPPKS